MFHAFPQLDPLSLASCEDFERLLLQSDIFVYILVFNNVIRCSFVHEYLPVNTQFTLLVMLSRNKQKRFQLVPVCLGNSFSLVTLSLSISVNRILMIQHAPRRVFPLAMKVLERVTG